MKSTESSQPRQMKFSRAVVVGGTSGIGLAIARGLALTGYRVALVGRDTERGIRAVAALDDVSGSVSYHKADAADPSDIAQAMSEISSQLGGLDTLVTCIGGSALPAPFERKPIEIIRLGVETHLLGAMFSVHAALPHLRQNGGGTILMLASDAAKSPTPGEAVIGAAKAGVAMFARTLSLEVSRHSIRVNCLTPSIVRGTETYDRLMADEFSKKLFEKAESRARLGVVTPHDIVPLAVFLLSSAASKITGQVVSVNGGISAA